MNAKQLSPLIFSALLLLALPLGGSIINYSYDNAGRLVSADYGANRTISYAYDNAGNLVQSSQPSLGLSIGAVVNGQFTLSWPASPGGFVLESAVTVGTGAIWSANIGATPATNGNFLTVTLAIADATKFYRLRKL